MDRMFVLNDKCLMLDANSQYRARRSKEEKERKENTTLRLRVSAVVISLNCVLENSESNLLPTT